MSELTPSQIAILRWIDTTQHHRSSWNARFTKLTLTGRSGAITINVGDVRTLLPYLTTSAKPDSVHGLNDAGRAALSTEGLS